MVYGVHFLFLSPRMQIKFPKFKLSKKCTLKKSMKYNTKNNIAEKKNESCEVITFTLNSCLLFEPDEGWLVNYVDFKRRNDFINFGDL